MNEVSTPKPKVHSQVAQQKIHFMSSSEVLAHIPMNSRLLVITDKDGTLDNAHQTEEIHATPSSTIEALSSVFKVAEAGHTVAVVSGRSLVDLMVLTGEVEDFWYFGNHGLEIRKPGAERGVVAIAEEFFSRLQECETILRNAVSERAHFEGRILIERDHLKLISWWEINSTLKEEYLECLHKALQESALQEITQLLHGVNSLEILPKGAGKGSAVKTLVEEIKPDFVVCAGNDLPDLAMYQFLKDSPLPHLNIVVGADISFEGAVHLSSPHCLTEVFRGIGKFRAAT